jgi:hypothetical protein
MFHNRHLRRSGRVDSLLDRVRKWLPEQRNIGIELSGAGVVLVFLFRPSNLLD